MLNVPKRLAPLFALLGLASAAWELRVVTFPDDTVLGDPISPPPEVELLWNGVLANSSATLDDDCHAAPINVQSGASVRGNVQPWLAGVARFPSLVVEDGGGSRARLLFWTVIDNVTYHAVSQPFRLDHRRWELPPIETAGVLLAALSLISFIVAVWVTETKRKAENRTAERPVSNRDVEMADLT